MADPRPLEDYEGWARRMIDEIEDFNFAKTRNDFLKFVDDNAIGDSLSASETRRNRQLRAIEKGRPAVIEMQKMVGVKKTRDQQTFTYKTGRMAGKTVTRSQVHYRDYETNKFIKFNAARYNDRIQEIKMALDERDRDEKKAREKRN